MPRAKVMPDALLTAANSIMEKYRIFYDNGTFKKEKPNRQWSWDSHFLASLIASPNALRGCCGVVEMYHIYPPPSRTSFPAELTPEEWTTLFQYSVRATLQRFQRRMAIITLTGSQKKCVPLVESAGFKVVSQGYNPGTRHKVTVWALSI